MLSVWVPALPDRVGLAATRQFSSWYAAPPARRPRLDGGKCPYALLGVPRTVSISDAKKAYLQLALNLHPDRNKRQDAAAAFQQLTQAYKLVLQNINRTSYWRPPSLRYAPPFSHLNPRGRNTAAAPQPPLRTVAQLTQKERRDLFNATFDDDDDDKTTDQPPLSATTTDPTTSQTAD